MRRRRAMRKKKRNRMTAYQIAGACYIATFGIANIFTPSLAQLSTGKYSFAKVSSAFVFPNTVKGMVERAQYLETQAANRTAEMKHQLIQCQSLFLTAAGSRQLAGRMAAASGQIQQYEQEANALADELKSYQARAESENLQAVSQRDLVMNQAEPPGEEQLLQAENQVKSTLRLLNYIKPGVESTAASAEGIRQMAGEANRMTLDANGTASALEKAELEMKIQATVTGSVYGSAWNGTVTGNVYGLPAGSSVTGSVYGGPLLPGPALIPGSVTENVYGVIAGGLTSGDGMSCPNPITAQPAPPAAPALPSSNVTGTVYGLAPAAPSTAGTSSVPASQATVTGAVYGSSPAPAPAAPTNPASGAPAGTASTPSGTAANPTNSATTTQPSAPDSRSAVQTNRPKD